MDNMTNFDKFSFKPDCLLDEGYQKLFENRVEGTMGHDEFGKKHELMHCFIKSKTPKDFVLSLIKSSIKIPTNDPEIVLNIINQIKDSVDKNELDLYVAKFYSTEGKNSSTEELIENIKEAERATELEKGIFVDVDGTLIRDGKLNNKLAETLKKSSDRVVIFSGGDPDLQTKKLRELGFPEELLPVVSKDQYKSKMLERLIDDTVPNYQGFETIIHFTPNGNDISCGREIFLPSKILDFNIEKIKSLAENPEAVKRLKRRGLDIKASLMKIKLFE